MNHPTQPPKCIMITGANGGIGQEIIKKLAPENIDIIAVDIVTDNLQQHTHIIHIEKCDITNMTQVNKLWMTLSQQNIKVDGLINNAGIFPACNWDQYTLELAQHTINTNLISAFMMSQAFANQTDKGMIINISSVAAFIGSTDPVYAASKAGLIGLTKALARNLAPNIRVNAIAPAVVDTKMKKTPPELLIKFREGELLIDCIKPEAIADAILFLCTSSHITGSTIDVNNGLYLR